jgi:ribosomal protein S27AE
MSDYDKDLVDSAVIHLKAKEFDSARRFLERALDVADDPDTRARASWHLSQITDDPARKRSLLEDVLSYDRNHAEARRALAILLGKLKPEDVIDPDKLAPQPEGEVTAARADRFTCPNCGARMVFAPDGGALLCENCGYREGQQAADPGQFGGGFGGGSPEEQDFIVAMATAAGHRKPVAMHAFTCRGCGANFILPPEVISATCSYCGTPHVLDVKAARELLPPDAVIPFAFGQQRAERILSDWAPPAKDGNFSPPRGIYLPVWTFDLNGEIPYTAEIKVKDGNQTVVRYIHDTYPVLYNDVAVPASRKSEALLRAALPAYRIGDAAAYDPRYLADWPAEVYEISMSDASLEARARSVRRMQRQIGEYLQTAYDGFSTFTTSSAILSAESFKLVLVPAWITTYPTGAQLRQVLVDGQTGSVHGEDAPKGPFDWLGKLFS